DGARDTQGVLFEFGHAGLQIGDGGVLSGVGGFESRDAVTEGYLVATEQDDEFADVRDVGAVALDGGVDATEVNVAGHNGAAGSALERVNVALHEADDTVEVSDVRSVLAAERVG